MVAVARPSSPPLVQEAVGLTYRKYQEEGTRFLWENKRGMITDAPGLGKTPQAALAAQTPCIVVCPTYLVNQWATWLRTHFPARKVVVAKGNRQEKFEALLSPADWLVVNKEMLRTHMAEIVLVAEKFRYRTVIFDESHHLRNRATGVARGASALADKVERVYLLTATPIWKEPDDLFMQLHLMFPSVFKSYNEFVDTYCQASTDRFGTHVTGVKKDMLGELEDLMNMVRVGRTYQQAGRDLPPVIENVIQLEFDKTEQSRYDTAVYEYRLKLEGNEDHFMSSFMEVMHTLRNMTGLEKVDPILDTISDAEPLHHGKYVVYTWYRDIADRLHARIPGSVLITGDMKPEDRVRLAATQRPIIASISALSEGVDLSWARMVIYAEEHWPPGSQVQSLARVRRERLTAEETRQRNPNNYGEAYDKAFATVLAKLASERRELNEEPVLVYCIHVKGTIDETIHNTSRARSATAKEVLSEALGIYL